MRALAAWCGLLLGCGRLHFDTVGVPDDAATTDTSCDLAAQPTVLQELHTGELVIGAAATTTLEPLVLPIDRTILFTSIREAEPSPGYGNTMCTLAPDGIACVRLTAGTDYASSTGEIHVRWTTATFSRGVTVQRGVANVTVSTPALVTVTTIDPATSFLLLGGGYMNNGGSWGTDEFMRGRIVDAQTVEVQPIATSGVASWQVVSLDGAHVQRGTLTLAMTDLTTSVPISVVDPTHSFVLVSNSENSQIALGAALSMVSATLDTSTSLHIQRAGNGAPIDVAWEVISLPFTVEHGIADMAAGSTALTFPVTARETTSVALAPYQSVLGQSGGTTSLQTADGAIVDMVGEATATLSVTAGNVAVERASSLAASSIAWSAIDFASCP